MINLTNIKSVKIEENKIEFGVNQKQQPTIRRSRLMTSGKNKGAYKTIEAYYFKSEESRAEWVEKMVTRFVAEKNAKAAKLATKKEVRANMEHPFKAGEVLYASWGYEQTNIDFYQIVEVKGKQIVIREIGKTMVEQTSHDSGRVRPIVNEFESEPIKKNIQFYLTNENKPVFYVRMDGARGSLSLYTQGEKGCYCSWGY